MHNNNKKHHVADISNNSTHTAEQEGQEEMNAQYHTRLTRLVPRTHRIRSASTAHSAAITSSPSVEETEPSLE